MRQAMRRRDYYPLRESEVCRDNESAPVAHSQDSARCLGLGPVVHCTVPLSFLPYYQFGQLDKCSERLGRGRDPRTAPTHVACAVPVARNSTAIPALIKRIIV